MATDSFGNKSLVSRKKQSHIDVGDNKTAVRVNDATVSSNKLTVAGEAIAFGAGAQGTTGVVSVDKAPIYDSDGSKIGDINDTSFAFVTGTVLTTEVVFNQHQTDTEQLAALGNGEFAIDYDLGKIRYCKDTAGTTDTVNYSSRQMNVVITAGEEINIGAVEIKDAAADTRVSVIAPNSAATGYYLGVQPGRYLATPPTLTDTYTSPLLLGLKNQLLVNLYDGTNYSAILADGADGVVNTTDQLVVGGMTYGFNGTTWDRSKNATALNDSTLAGTLPSYCDFSTGVHTTVMLGHDNTAGAMAYRAIAVNSSGEFEVEVDGVYDAANTDPDNVGLIAHDVAAAPADTDQTIRLTGGIQSADTLVEANSFGLDTRSLNFFDDSGAGVNRRQQGDANGNSYITHRNAANSMPAGDATARPIFTKLGDGTDDVNIHDATALVIDDVATNDGIQTASLLYGYDDTGAAETWRGVHVDTSGNIVLSSDIQIGAVEIKNADTDDRVDVHALNTAAYGFGMGVLPAHYLAAPGALTDTFASPLLLGTNGQLLTNLYDGTSTLALGTGTIKTLPCAISDGTSTVDIGVDASAMAALPEFVPIGGEYRASDTTYTDGNATVAQTDINGYLKTRPKGYDAGTDSQKVFEVSPISQQFVSESLVDSAAYADDTTTRYPSDTGATMDGYGDISLTGKLVCAGGTVTLTIEATNDEDTTAGDWIDITKAFYDAENNTTGNASYVATAATLTFAIDADNFNYRHYRIVVVSAGVGGVSTAIIKARRKAL